jgi:hypothetical protein
VARKCKPPPPPPPNPPLNRFVRGLFYDEIAEQCIYTMHATADLNASLQGHPNPDRTWYAIQNLLNAAANISKLLWGDYKDQAVQRLPLRERLAVEDASPLKWRSIRNHSEHIDSRLIAQYGTRGAEIHVGRNIGPKALYQVGVEDEWFHHYDDVAKEVSFWTDTVSLQAIIDEVSRILPLAQAASKAP